MIFIYTVKTDSEDCDLGLKTIFCIMKFKRGSRNKVHISSKDTHCNKLLNSNFDSKEKQKNTERDSQFDNLQESHIVSTRTLKRGSTYLSQDEVNIGTSLKFKITQKEGKRLRVIATSHEKLDADVARNDADSVTCSVGSCSINSDCNIQSKSNAYEDSKTYGSDAESACEGGYEGYEDKIHRLELQAYCRTIEALHASGPLTWEKESMAQSWMLVHLAYEFVS
ncbi:uncharacterized protein LOC143566778 [Bidens hawaiensis]|uniref:uncharacterized protein LOC143566778 n=1 Tax=Bidens hawaiensis TaxID=980011 RepID=UPI0040499D71